MRGNVLTLQGFTLLRELTPETLEAVNEANDRSKYMFHDKWGIESRSIPIDAI